VRAFILKYQDRILYGIDLHFDSGSTDQTASQTWENQYVLDWHYFATDDTFEYQGRKIEGLNLPPPVLKKLYHYNAVHWIRASPLARAETSAGSSASRLGVTMFHSVG
jgi:hypothetical protein